jgi:hypothetical protein
MQITAIPANADNYMYLVVDEKNKLAAIVDPVDVNSVKSESVEKIDFFICRFWIPFVTRLFVWKPLLSLITIG